MDTLFPCPKAKAVREHMAYTTGSEQWFKHYSGMLYTSGMDFVAKTCEAYWLLDLVASHQPEIKKRWPNDHDFQVWRLTVQEGPTFSWLVEAWSDTPHTEGSTMLTSQEIPYSDFPRELSPFEFWVEGNTMLLKQEH